jgi:hypothetical protein
MLKINKASSKDNGSDCVRYLKENAELKAVLIEASDEYSYHCRQYEDEITSQTEGLSSYRQWMNARAKLEAIRDKYRPRSKSEKTMLGRVGGPESNINLRTPSSVKGEENEY